MSPSAIFTSNISRTIVADEFLSNLELPESEVTEEPLSTLEINKEWMKVLLDLVSEADFVETYTDTADEFVAEQFGYDLYEAIRTAYLGYPPGTVFEVPDIIIIEHQEPIGTEGGIATAGAWFNRVLNTIVQDDTGLVTLVNNLIGLPDGLYSFDGYCIGYRVNHHDAHLYNVTDAIQYGYGSSEYAQNSTNAQTHTRFAGKFQIAQTTEFSVRHQVQTTVSPNGLGRAGVWVPGVFTQVRFFKWL